MSIPRLKRHENRIWYVHWTEGRRAKRISLKTYDLAVAKLRFSEWLKPPPEAPVEPAEPSSAELGADGPQTPYEDDGPEPIDPAFLAAMRHAVDQISLGKPIDHSSRPAEHRSKGVAKTTPSDGSEVDVSPERPAEFCDHPGTAEACPTSTGRFGARGGSPTGPRAVRSIQGSGTSATAVGRPPWGH